MVMLKDFIFRNVDTHCIYYRLHTLQLLVLLCFILILKTRHFRASGSISLNQHRTNNVMPVGTAIYIYLI